MVKCTYHTNDWIWLILYGIITVISIKWQMWAFVARCSNVNFQWCDSCKKNKKKKKTITWKSRKLTWKEKNNRVRGLNSSTCCFRNKRSLRTISAEVSRVRWLTLETTSVQLVNEFIYLSGIYMNSKKECLIMQLNEVACNCKAY